MQWILIIAATGLMAAFVVGRLEQRLVRKVIVKSVKCLGIETKSLEVRIGWAWPLNKNLSILAEVQDPADMDKMNAVVEKVSLWLDDRWG